MKPKPLKLITIGATFALGVGIGVYGWGAALASETTPTEEQMEIKENSQNDRYGSLAYHDQADLDLVEAIGVDGTLGYIKTSDINEDLPKTPEEAIQSMKIKKADRYINLYDSEGNIIGKFKLGGSEN